MNHIKAIIHEPADHSAFDTSVSLAELFAGTQLSGGRSLPVPAVEIVHFDHDQHQASTEIRPLNSFILD